MASFQLLLLGGVKKTCSGQNQTKTLWPSLGSFTPLKVELSWKLKCLWVSRGQFFSAAHGFLSSRGKLKIKCTNIIASMHNIRKKTGDMLMHTL